MEFVTGRQLELAVKRIEKANLKKNGRSLSAGSMRFTDLIVDQRVGGLFLMDDNWRSILKERFLE